MVFERRGGTVQAFVDQSTISGRSYSTKAKHIEISKIEVLKAYKRVKSNKGGSGVDDQSIEMFEVNLKDNLYKLWNRLSSGSYMPSPVLRVEIAKTGGGMRPLGIPTITDRIAQMVVKQRIEPELEGIFHPNSYGYRPNKSALEAVALARKRCWKRGWVLDMDIKGFFDAIDHKLLMRAVKKHVVNKWEQIYIERWLKAPVKDRNGRQETRVQGTPQGGVISPLLANLYLHYVFDMWVEQNWHDIQFERYADDIVCHCESEEEATRLKQKLEERFESCGLTLHPKKTKIVYCKSSSNRQSYPAVSFDFVGYTFKPKLSKTRYGRFFVGFSPAISRKSAKSIKKAISSWSVFRISSSNLMNIASFSRTRIRGWVNYFGKYGRAEFYRVLFHMNGVIIRWAKRKYKRLKSLKMAVRWLIGVRYREPQLFAHWVCT